METRPIEHSICERVWSGLDPFLRDDLDAIARGDILRHLARCVPCARDLDELADLKRALRSALAGAPAPRGLRDEVRARLRAASGDDSSSRSRNASASTRGGSSVHATLLDRELADLPSLDFGDARYDVRFAVTRDEVDAALRLRFEVFNLELGEGLAASLASGRDEDEFDAFCRHGRDLERARARRGVVLFAEGTRNVGPTPV